MKVKKFHQFVVLEKGPVNTAIIDFLKGNIYQIGNDIMDKFLNGDHQEIGEFILGLEEEELIFEVDEKDWIPAISFEENEDESFQLEIEEGVDLDLILRRFRGFKISAIIYNGKELPERLPSFVEFTHHYRSYNDCLELTEVESRLEKIDEHFYRFNRHYNSCWGKKVAVTKDGKIRPCVHSHIVIGELAEDNIEGIVDEAKKYWEITKDRAEKCKVCELRYCCFDCREIAFRECGNSLAVNPYCKYDPLTGRWAIINK